MTLTDFLLARIAEDEAAAETLRRGHDFGWQPKSYQTVDPGILWVNPARVLAECEAKRRIVEDHFYLTVGLGVAVRHLAAVYADHPDYRDEWKP